MEIIIIMIFIVAIVTVIWNDSSCSDCYHPITLVHSYESIYTKNNWTYIYRNSKGGTISSRHDFINTDGSFDYDNFYYHRTNPIWEYKDNEIR